MSDVPDEVLREILSRLPVAPLLRFRCVSKSWKVLIKSQEFIKHHLNHSRKTNSNLHIVLRSRPYLYYADFDLLKDTNMATFKQLPHPLQTPSGGTEIVGSCDGLLVLRNDADDETELWNLSVRKFHVIPSCGGFGLPRHDKCFFYGFGYDVVSDDYKLIRIFQDHSKDYANINAEVQVYSLKSDSWRRIPDFPYYVGTDGLLMNGALHWIVTGKVKFDDLVAAFDLGTEEYRLVPLPIFAVNDDVALVDMVVLGGCLSLMCYDAHEGRVDIWVMKEYGIQESWSILVTFDFCDFNFKKPIAFSKCGRKVLLLGLIDFPVFTWYDLDKKSTDVPMIQMPLKNINDTYSCLESLVLLNDGTRDSDIVTKKEQERDDKLGQD